MPSPFDAQTMSLGQLFSSFHSFQTPPFQRSFVWEEDTCCHASPAPTASGAIGSPILPTERFDRAPGNTGPDHQGTERQSEQPRLHPQEASAVQYSPAPVVGSQRICAPSIGMEGGPDRRAGNGANGSAGRALGVRRGAWSETGGGSPAKRRKEAQAAGRAVEGRLSYHVSFEPAPAEAPCRSCSRATRSRIPPRSSPWRPGSDRRHNVAKWRWNRAPYLHLARYLDAELASTPRGSVMVRER